MKSKTTFLLILFCLLKNHSFAQNQNAENISACNVDVISVNTLVCMGMCNGQMTALATGTAPFTYQWSTGQSTQSIQGLCDGMYWCTIEDSAGCISTDSLRVMTDSVNVATQVHSTSCIGCDDGTIILTITDFVAPISISIDPFEGTITTDSIYNLPAGSYQVCVTDAQGCVSCVDDTIYEDPTSVFEIDDRIVSVCPNPTTGKIVIGSDQKIISEKISVCNLLGEILLTKEISGYSTEADLSGLAAGVYFIKMKENKVLRVVRQ